MEVVSTWEDGKEKKIDAFIRVIAIGLAVLWKKKRTRRK